MPGEPALPAPILLEPEISHLPEGQAALLEDWITGAPHLPPPELEIALQQAAWGGPEDVRKIAMLTSGAAAQPCCQLFCGM